MPAYHADLSEPGSELIEVAQSLVIPADPWLIDPLARTLDVFQLEAGRWMVLGLFAKADTVRSEPFQEVEIHLGSLWLEKRWRRSE